MSYELKENQFTIFRNKKKDKDSQPDYRGQIKIGGVVYELSAWVKESKSGEKFFSGQAQQPKEDKPRPSKKDQIYEDENDLPF